MQLKYENSIRKRVITIELETYNFTQAEIKALDQFGEPVIKFEKNYAGNFPVAISKSIRSGFKVRVKFDGTEDIEGATAAANQFFEEIQEVLEEEMRNLLDKYNDLNSEFQADKGIISFDL